MAIYLKTEEEISLMRAANRLVGSTLGELAKIIKPGISTGELNRVAEEYIRDNGAEPTFLGFPNPNGPAFPASICCSVNECVVHGIPSDDIILKDGDIVSVDCGTLLNGYNGDSAYTFPVGEISEEVRQLLRTTKESLYLGIEKAVHGGHVGDIGATVQDYCEARGYGVVRELCGHGIGRSMHEDPQVPNYGKHGNGAKLKAGMCIAIEPMITMGGRAVWMMPDKWSICTRDGKPAAHYEHTIAIYKGKAEILSSFEEVEEIIKI